jgi:glycerol-3-phosphate dehydrogenase (NAD(P)+)
MTLMGLAGLGDLVATCSSSLSRNRTFGEKLGQGMSTEEITASTRQIAEGVKSCGSLLALAERSDVYAPLVAAVHSVIVGEMTVDQMIESFLTRETKNERD